LILKDALDKSHGAVSIERKSKSEEFEETDAWGGCEKQSRAQRRV
jgi:hypothetical protein